MSPPTVLSVPSTSPDTPDLSPQPLPEHHLTDQLVNRPGANTPENEPNKPGINPEDLPFEDPESDVDGSEDGIGDTNRWWEVSTCVEQVEYEMVDNENGEQPLVL